MLIYTEVYNEKKDGMAREKFLKSGKGRDLLKEIVNNFLT